MFAKKPHISSSDAKKPDYEKLGRQFERVLINDYIDLLQSTKRQLWLSFIKGVAGGLGGIIGATVMVGLILFILSRLGGLPVVGDLFRNISHSLTTGPKR